MVRIHCLRHLTANLTQLVEYHPSKLAVVGSTPIVRSNNFNALWCIGSTKVFDTFSLGSNPGGATIYATLAQLVEQHTFNVRVTSSNLVSRTIIFFIHTNHTKR